MMETPIPSDVPKPPKAIGISRRLLLTIAGLVLFIVVLFLVFLNHYAPRPKKMTPSTVAASDHSDASMALIEKIEQKAALPSVLHESNHTATDFNGFASSKNNEESGALSGNAFKAAGNAPISVYHALVQTPLFSLPSSRSSVNRDSFHSSQRFDGTNSASDVYSRQNQQSEKHAFLQAQTTRSNDVLSSRQKAPISPYEIDAGTIIPATLVTGINSDLPGSVIAKVRRDVFDTVTGNYLLIPQGTTLIGRYDSHVAYGQSRVLIAWSRLIFPNGASFDLQGMPGADLMGMAGLHDQVDNHYFRIFGSALLFSLFGAAGQLSQPQNNSQQLTAQQMIYGAIGQQMSQAAMQLVAKNMNIQPTIKIRPGTNFNVLVTRDMVLPGPYHFSS